MRTHVYCTVLLLTFCACGQEYYTMDDFSTIEKIDTHVHLNAESPVLAELAKATQVLFFTHHQHLVDIARATLGESLPVVSLCDEPITPDV